MRGALTRNEFCGGVGWGVHDEIGRWKCFFGGALRLRCGSGVQKFRDSHGEMAGFEVLAFGFVRGQKNGQSLAVLSNAFFSS